MPYLSVNNIDLYYTDSGTGDPLVFLHGWGTSGRVWDQQAAHFASRNRVIQLDWRGCGLSEAIASGNTIAQIAQDVGAVLNSLDLTRVTLIGASMGASFAIETARRYPQRLQKVVTVDGPFHMGKLVDPGTVEPLIEAIAKNRIPALTQMVSSWYTGTNADAYEEWARIQVLNSSPHIASLYRDHLSYDPRPYLPDITVPITLIHGADDPEIPVTISAEISALLGGAQLHVINGAGHFPHHTCAVQFNRVLETVLDGIETAR